MCASILVRLIKGIPLVMLNGTYQPRKTKCPSLKKRFIDDGLIPIFRPRPYKGKPRRRNQHRWWQPKPLPPMTIRVELFPPVKRVKQEITYDHSPSGTLTFCGGYGKKAAKTASRQPSAEPTTHFNPYAYAAGAV